MATNKISKVTRHSLKDCVQRIRHLNNEDILFSDRVRIWQVDEQTADYEIRIWRFMNFLGTVSGDLTYQDVQSTLVTGQAQLARHLKIGITLFTLVATIITVGEILSGKFPLGLIGIPWGFLCWFVWTWMCNRVFNSVMKQLE
jgi:hypothetical protein